MSVVAILLCIGIIFIYSSSSVYALERLGAGDYFFKRHIMGLLLGFITFCGMALVPVNVIKKSSPYLFFITFILTILTLVPPFSVRIHGSSRWIKLGNFMFQPSELLKITFLIYISYFISKHSGKLRPLTTLYIPCLILVFFVSAVLLKQPDFGLTVTIATTILLVLFLTGTPITYLIATIAPALPAIAVLIYTQPYRMKRIMVFLNPWADPQGSGFQIIQSLIAIGSGSWTGAGISHSKQKFFYLPMLHTDFIFSIIAEEVGLLGVIIIVILYIVLLYSGIRIALRLRDPFAQITTLSFILVITLQALINISVTMGLIPTKGIGLPFISYGNTSLVCMMAMIGFIVAMTYEDMTCTH